MPNSKRIETYTLQPSSTQSCEQRDLRHHSLRVSMQPSLRQRHIQHSELSSRLKIEKKRVASSWGRARVTKTNLPAKTPRPNLTKTSQKQSSKASVSTVASLATENLSAGARRKTSRKRCDLRKIQSRQTRRAVTPHITHHLATCMMKRMKKWKMMIEDAMSR